MNSNTEQEFRQHAEQEYPRECCGLIAVVKGKEKYFPCNNKSSNKDHFVLDPKDYANAEDQGEILAVCHSHVDFPATASQADRVSCEASQLIWHIVRVDKEADTITSKEIVTIQPNGYIAPLVGRTFHHGVLDCYAIVRDWYKEVKGITLEDFERADGWWDDKVSNLYLDNFQKAGFKDIGTAGNPSQEMQPEIGDVILMQIRSKNNVPNHAGVYIGDGMILHHLHGRLSSRDVYGGYLLENTRKIIRYYGN